MIPIVCYVHTSLVFRVPPFGRKGNSGAMVDMHSGYQRTVRPWRNRWNIFGVRLQMFFYYKRDCEALWGSVKSK